jgi:predicted  nucleic acid-binding Zn-ribbon protein
MTSAADLLSLQEIDLRRDGRRAMVADIEARLGESEELQAARRRVEEAESALEGLRRQQRDLDARLEDLDAKIGPLESKLYGGSVRNPKELTDLQKELNALKARRGELDDEGLQLLDDTEAAQASLGVEKANFRRVEADWKRDQAQLRSEQVEAEAEIERLNRDRETRASIIDPASLAQYERLRTAKQGRAVARIERGICQGCRLTLPSNLVQRVRTGVELVPCPSCERILVSLQ